MTSFSFAVQSTCLVVLGSLLVYTVALMRSGRLSAFITVRWIIAEAAAVLAVLVWGRLPVIGFTSRLGDRELLVILAVLFFGLITFLMLDSLQRISDHSGQLRRLTQEVALLHARLAATAGSDAGARTPEPLASPAPRKRRGPQPFAITVMVMWIVGCVTMYVVQSRGGLPASIVQLLSAAYLQ